MTEELKVWALVDEDNQAMELYADKQEAVENSEIIKGRGMYFEIKELVEKETEKIAIMNEAQYKELIKLNDITPRYNVYGALSMVLESIECVNLRKAVSADNNIAQARFADLWLQLESTDIDELVEVIKPNVGIMDKEQIKFTTDEFIALHKALEILMINQQERKAQKSSVTFEVEDGKKARITFEDLSDYENKEEGN